MARSISAASRTLTGLTSTPSDGATAWMMANWPIPAVMAGSRRIAARVTPRRDLLEQLQPFPADAKFEHAGNRWRCRPAAPGWRQSRRRPDRGRSRTRSARRGSPVAMAPRERCPWPAMTSGASASQFRGMFAIDSASPAPQRTSIRTLRPSVQPSCCSACRNAAKRARPSGSSAAGRRARRCAASARPVARAPRAASGCRATEQRDELAPPHVLPLVRGSDPTTSL